MATTPTSEARAVPFLSSMPFLDFVFDILGLQRWKAIVDVLAPLAARCALTPAAMGTDFGTLVALLRNGCDGDGNGENNHDNPSVARAQRRLLNVVGGAVIRYL